MKEKEFYLVNVGRLVFTRDFNKIFCSQNKYIVSAQVDKDYYFEMNGESMYYMLKGEEISYDFDYHSYKEKIVNAICARISECDGLLLHKSLVSDECDTQFRATNSAIRILFCALLEGYSVKSELVSLINYQYNFYFPLMGGIWFPHDSSEYKGEFRKRQLKTNAYGKDKTNTVTLNTHLDSLNTLLLISSYCEEYKLNLRVDVDSLIGKAIIPIKHIFYKDNNHSAVSKIFQNIDTWFYKKSKKRSVWRNSLVKIYESAVHPILFKLIFPRMFFRSGYIARDLAIRHRHADYILPNAVDLARFISLYEKRKDCSKDFVDDLKTYLSKTISLIENLENLDIEYSMAWYHELVNLAEALKIPIIKKSLRGESIKFNPFIVE